MIIGDYPWWEDPLNPPIRPGSPYRPGGPPWKQPIVPNPFEPYRDGPIAPYRPCNGIHVDLGFAMSPEFEEAQKAYNERVEQELKDKLEAEELEKKRKAEEKAAKDKEKRRQLFEELKKEFENEQ